MVEVNMVNSLQEPNHDFQLRLWPNPCIDILNLDLGAFPQKEGMISIYDATGRMQWSCFAQAGRSDLHEISLEGLLPGLYFVRYVYSAGMGEARVLKLGVQ
jgi:hypothetical protein